MILMIKQEFLLIIFDSVAALGVYMLLYFQLKLNVQMVLTSILLYERNLEPLKTSTI